MKEKPKLSVTGDKELDRLDSQFQKFDEEVKSMTHERMRNVPKQESDPQTKMSTREAQKYDAPWLKPERTISDGQKFNERFQQEYEHAAEYVRFVAENKEIIGESIEIWTHPYGGKPAEFWRVPVNKPVMGPRHLAEQIKRCTYHRLVMQETTMASDGYGKYYGSIAADTTIQRLDAHPVSERKTTFMSGSF